MCDVFSIIHLDYFYLKQYFIEIKFLNLEELTGLEIKDMIFTVSFNIIIL